mgnify:CR=1 FL=1
MSSGGQLFFTSYFAGRSDTDGKNSGRLRQNGSNYLASTSRIHIQRFFIITMIIHPTIIRPLALSKSIDC